MQCQADFALISDGLTRRLCSARRCFAGRGSRAWLPALSAALIAACGGGGGGSSQFIDPPTVIATPIGYRSTSAAGSPVAITVRSGADVQLSGKDSYGGNTSITSFQWQQSDAAPSPQVQLLYRNSSTVSFTAPSVAADTTLNFKLTVTNAVGLSGSATVQVLVKSANDPNRFLNLPTIPHHFRVGVSTQAGLSNLSADVPVCVKLQRTISYTPRSGAANSGSFALPVQQIDAKWLATVGGAAGFPAQASLSYTNPVVSFLLPVRNDEDLFAQFNGPDGDVSHELVPADVDSMYVAMAVTAAPGSCDGTLAASALASSLLVLKLYDESGQAIGTPATAQVPGGAVTIDSTLGQAPLTADGSSALTPDDFLRAQSLLTAGPSQLETRESATAYYLAIDPNSSKTTLSAWLVANCFDPNAANYGVGESGYNVAHADYTNNFDLGFGRDMYFATCSNGDMAAVVVNYPSLEAAVTKLGAFLAVAMEYTPPTGSTMACFSNPADPTTNTGACFTKFFAFAPDDRTGAFQRVLSANFDRRGQKYVPGACTACHSGTPQFTSGLPYPHAGNIDSAFMPWDQGSLLFSDTDPSFACNISALSPDCASINPAQYTLSAQAPNIQKLNALTWRTLQSPAPGDPERYQALKDLITKWYGSDPASSTAHAYDDSVTPTLWLTGETTSSSTDLYHQVFAHYCRSCHTELTPQFNSLALQFSTYADFLLFSSGHLKLVEQAVFEDAEMPLSRLTTDRFWVNFDGGESAAQTLAQYLNGVQGPGTVAMDGQQVVGPGQPQITVLNSATTKSLALSPAPNELTRFQGATLDALSQSLFIASYQWSLCQGGPVSASTGLCPSGTLGLIGTPVAAAGGAAGPAEPGASLPALPTNTPGTYYLTLNASSAIIDANASTVTYELVVPQAQPALAHSSQCPSAQASASGTPITIDVTSCFVQANGTPQLGDPAYRLQISSDGVNYYTCINSTGCATVNAGLLWAAAVSSGQSVNASGQNGFVPTISFSFVPPGVTGGATLYYRWCDVDNVCVLGSTVVALTP